jgi:glycosyltransferase involved in cell wall biosynthesis
MDTNLRPKVSIQMCTYNRAHYIEQAIQSVIAQTFTNWELLILDDTSTDNTEEVIFKYQNDQRIKYFKNDTNLGIAKNRNRGLALSQGKYIAVLDSDDYWIDKTKLEKQVEFLDKNTEYGLVGTNIEIVDENSKLLKNINYPNKDSKIKKQMLIKNNFCHSSVLFSKENVVGIGLYDESLPLAEDYDLFLRIGLDKKLENLDIASVAYRKHSGQSYSNKKKVGLEIQNKLIEKYKKNYSNYLLAKFVNFLRSFR